MKVFVVFSAVLALAAAAPGVYSVDDPSTFRKIIANCLASDDTMTCLSIKGIMALNRVANIEILPGISLQRDSSISARSAKAISENEIVDSLPAEESERSGRLFDLAIDSLTNFIESHSLQVKFPRESSQFFARTVEEGRGLLKKHGSLLMALCLKLIGFMALKALIASKIAIFMSQGHKGGLLGRLTGSPLAVTAWQPGPQSAGWSSATGVAAQYPNARSYDNAQDLAYNAYDDEVPALEQ